MKNRYDDLTYDELLVLEQLVLERLKELLAESMKPNEEDDCICIYDENDLDCPWCF